MFFRIFTVILLQNVRVFVLPRLMRKNGRAPPAPHAESAVQARIARPLCCFLG